MIANIKDLMYSKRLEVLNLPSLHYRRKRGDMIMLYKIMTNKVNVNVESFFTLNKNKTRGHLFKIDKRQRATKLPRCQTFSIRATNDWNSLPSIVVQAASTNEFKNKLDVYWKNKRFESPYM